MNLEKASASHRLGSSVHEKMCQVTYNDRRMATPLQARWATSPMGYKPDGLQARHATSGLANLDNGCKKTMELITFLNQDHRLVIIDHAIFQHVMDVIQRGP